MLSCVLCGAACGPRSEQCRVTDNTKAKLLFHAEDLKNLGLLLRSMSHEARMQQSQWQLYR